MKIFSCFKNAFACFIMLSSVLHAEEPFLNLKKYNVSKLEGTLERIMGPFKGSKEVIQKEKMRMKQQALAQMNPGGKSLIRQKEAEKLIEKTEKDYFEGSHVKYAFSCYLGKDSILLNLRKLDDSGKITSESWDQQYSEKAIEYSPTTESIAIYQHALGQWSDLGILSYALGNFGELGNEVISGKTESNSTQKIPITGKYGTGEASYTIGQAGMLGKYTEIFKNGLSSSWEFGGYVPWTSNGKARSFPMQITQDLKMESRDEKIIVKINNIEMTKSYQEIGLPKFGVVSVKDARFQPPLEYICNAALPNDEVVAKMVADESFKEQFSRDAQRNLR